MPDIYGNPTEAELRGQQPSNPYNPDADPNAQVILTENPNWKQGQAAKGMYSDAKNGSLRKWMNDHPLGVMAAFIAAAAGGAGLAGGFGGAGAGGGAGFGTAGPASQAMGTGAMSGFGSGASVAGGGSTWGGLLGAGGMGGASQGGDWQQYAKQGQGLMNNQQKQQGQPNSLRVWTDPANNYVPADKKKEEADALRRALTEYKRVA